jgi:hypothetical protein
VNGCVSLYAEATDFETRPPNTGYLDANHSFLQSPPQFPTRNCCDSRHTTHEARCIMEQGRLRRHKGRGADCFVYGFAYDSSKRRPTPVSGEVWVCVWDTVTFSCSTREMRFEGRLLPWLYCSNGELDSDNGWHRYCNNKVWLHENNAGR